MRKRLYEIIEASKNDDRVSYIYDCFMMFVIFVSIVPLAFKREYFAFVLADRITLTVYIIDYILRWLTSDYKLQKGKLSAILYPFSPMAIIDLLCILPSLSLISNGFKMLKILRLIRTLRVFRIFKAVRYSQSIKIIINVFNNQKKSLLTVGFLALAYIVISALVIFNVEPASFDTFFDAVYWATVSLTTMGYGDIYPVTTVGRVVTMLSSIFGIAIIALPSGIITAGVMAELEAEKEKSRENGR